MQLACSACDFTSPIRELVNLCPYCTSPLLVQYDFAPRPRIAAGRNDMWRYRDVLPEVADEEIVSLGEGVTPLLASRTRPGVYIKDESKNPTRSFKSRGMSAAVTMAKKLGARSLAAPTAGNAGAALAAYGARAGLPVFVAMPPDTPSSIVEECRGYGATVELIPGVITDAAKRVREYVAEHGGFDLATLREPYRVEGKKIMGYELLDDLGALPDVILYPTGGGTGLIGMWKAFDEMERLGWIDARRPRMFSVQSSGCAPVVRAFEQGLDRAPEWESPKTTAWGLRVPRALGDRLMLHALRTSNGGAIAVDEARIEDAAAALRVSEGIDAGPESGAAWLAYEELRARGAIGADESVVVFNTGANKYR
ncbi:MAG: threonine synthase [Acidobacteria bacterium]|nr:threonine synthase [Acidobacteriota bacterium]MBV9477523.1 threonine synthase [Acidobacteriota bacterium]